MKKNKKIYLFLILVLFFLYTLLIFPINVYANDNINDETITEEKIYYQGTLDDNFNYDKIIVVLSKEETNKYKDYTPDDFPEIDCQSVTDLTQSIVNKIKNKEFDENKSLINLEKFNRILSLELKEKSKENVLKSIKELEKRNEILSAEPNTTIDVCNTPNDGKISEQWGLTNTKAYNAWNISQNASQVLVGVLDTGIDSTHEDLKDCIYKDEIHNEDTTLHRDFTDGSVDGKKIINPSDPKGHGTHVAGIIGAAGNNGIGISGICWNVKLISLRVLDSNGDGKKEWIVNAINYANSIDIPILNCSIGSSDGSSALRKAIESYKGLVVCAAGNNGKDIDSEPTYPASYECDNIISVGAIDSKNRRSDWDGFLNLWGLFGKSASNYGSKSVDIYAPGTDILSTVPNNKYDEKSGTSMATPFVTGAAALLLSANSSLSALELKEALINGADSITIMVPTPGCEGNKQTDVLKLNIENSIKRIAYKVDNSGEKIIGAWFDIKGDIYIPNIINGITIKAIGENAFRNCRNLQKVVIPNTVKNIDSSAFENCSYLQSVTLPSSLVAIGSSAFKDCGSLPSIEIPNSVRYIDSNAFENCSYLQSVTLPDKITSIGNSVFKDCGSLPSIVIPNSVEHIDSSAFENCSYLQNVTLSNNLFAIGTAAFKGCGSLKSIVLPSSVEYIDNEAFSNCSSLTSVIVNRAITGITNLGENAFTGCNSNLEITVPTNRIAEYKNKEYWTSYRNKIVPSEEYTKFDIDCESSLSYSLNLDKATNKLYRLNVNCSKSYKINVISSNPVNIIIYDSNMNVINRVSNTLTQFLGFGTYYVSFEFNNVNTSGMFEIGISLTWTSTDILLSSGNNDIKNSMHLNSENVYHCNYKYLKNQGDGFYRLSLNAGSDATYPVGAIRIYTDQNRTTLLNSYGTTEINKQAITCNDENELFVFFPENYYYYIEITLPNLSYTSISLTIEKVETQDLNYQNSLATTCLDELFTNKMNNSYFKEVTISHRSKIELDIITRGTIDVDIPVYIFEKYRDPGYDSGINHYYLNLEYTASITSTNRWPVFTAILNPGTYYIGYSDNINNVSIQFALIRKVNTDLNIDGTLVADPTGNAGFTIGSEVTLNNGAFLGNTITEGFTRCLYLMVEDRLSDPMSRLQYDWYSSDESVAIVTSYGTVIAQSVNVDTEVTIYAVLKEDPSVVYRKTFTILHDTKTYETNPLDYYLTMTIEAEKIEQINLSTLNVPIDMIQYYNWSGPSLLNIDLWGNICAEPNTQGMTFEVIGTYKLNPRVKIHITVYVN